MFPLSLRVSVSCHFARHLIGKAIPDSQNLTCSYAGGKVKYRILIGSSEFAIMDSESKSSCRSCPIHSSCRNDDGNKLSGWPLVGQAMAYFLLPLAAAIAGAATVKSENLRILIGCGSFAIAIAASAIIGLWVRQRRKITQ